MTEIELAHHEQQAAEYALGVLTAHERRQAERRMSSEPGFAAEVAAWEERLAPMLEALLPETPPRVVWMRIAAQLGMTVRPARGRQGMWHDITVWRAAAGIFAVAAAASFAVAVLTPPKVVIAPTPAADRPSEVTSVALLKDQAGPTAFVVTFDRDGGRLVIAPVTADVQADRSFELWLLPDGSAPVSLGVLNGKEALILRTDQLVGPDGSHASLAVTVEPLGGSPHGAPTGPVVASGQLKPV